MYDTTPPFPIPKPEQGITATIRNAHIEDWAGKEILIGDIYGDSRGRFKDGTTIHSSFIVSRDGDVFTTRNSIYRVESWHMQPAPPDPAPVPANDNATFVADRDDEQTASDINAFVALTHNASASAGWWNDPKTGEDLRTNPYVIGTKIGLIHSEVSEAMEGHRKGAMDDHLPHRKSIEVELADAMIRIGDMAGVLGLDLGGAIVEKMAYNARRADHKLDNRASAGGKAY